MRIPKRYRSLSILLLVFSYVIIGSFLVYKYQHPKGGNLFNLDFYYGPLIKNIVTNGAYRFGIFSAGRMPFIPLFLSAIALIHNGLLFAYVLKNLIFCSIIFVCMAMAYRHTKDVNRYILWAILLYAVSFPQLVLHSFAIEYGAGYLTAFLSILFVSLLYADSIKDSRLFILLAVINSLAYLTRGVMPLLSVLVCFFYYQATKSRRVFFIFASCLLISVAAWGVFNMLNSGRFDISVSIKGYNLYKGNNEDTLKIYPEYSVDKLSAKAWKSLPKDKALNEWEIDRYFISESLDFIKAYPQEAAKLFLLKCYVMFLSVTNTLDDNDAGYPLLQYIGILYMSVYRVILILCLVTAFIDIFAGKERVSFAYIGFIFGYSLFHLIGFAHQRHAVTLVPVTLFYLIWALERKVLKLSAG